MEGTEKLDKLKFNETIPTKELIPGMEALVGDTLKFVGKTYIFEGDGVLQEIKLWAKGFNIDDYNQE